MWYHTFQKMLQWIFDSYLPFRAFSDSLISFVGGANTPTLRSRELQKVYEVIVVGIYKEHKIKNKKFTEVVRSVNYRPKSRK